ncbi:MAG: 1-acyl-sn-glycerol-3-phosphate acyltransferase [Gaiellaceae bacterium]|jgi:1-acyl-sn-glycerol-3-phosphate acyltransferase|nr:1-acyl-sn-glycerol-3-phosphate acyltransferase [Gaiellaceae bacterium]
MGWPALLATRARAYGRERLPKTGGLVYAVNHMHWLDIPLVGVLSPRNIDFVAKVEAVRVPGIGRFLEWHGTIAVRRGESDRVAVRKMLESARSGRVVGLFVEGTRLKTGRPGTAQPGAAMVAIQAGVPVIPMAIYGTQFWQPTHPAPCSIAFGEPLRFDDLPKNGRGYKEATVEIERRINVLFDWLAEVHAKGRPKGLVPPV